MQFTNVFMSRISFTRKNLNTKRKFELIKAVKNRISSVLCMLS